MILMFVGGAIGGLCGGLGSGLNAMIARSQLPTAVKVVAILGVSGLSVGAWLFVATLIRTSMN